MTRLKKIASLDDLGEMNMPLDMLNQVLYTQGIDTTVETVLYRRLMNKNTKFIVELWQMSDKTFGVFSGKFNGMWTVGNIKYEKNFSSESEAESYIQNNLQGQAEYGETVMVESRLRVNNFRKLHASGDEPDYSRMAHDFRKQMQIPEVEMTHKTTLNKYYQDWVKYMEKYYPEWSKFPAFIWRGWGYFVDSTVKHEDEKSKDEKPKDEKQTEEPVKQQVEERPQQPQQNNQEEQSTVQQDTIQQDTVQQDKQQKQTEETNEEEPAPFSTPGADVGYSDISTGM